MQIRKFGRHLYTIFFLGGGKWVCLLPCSLPWEISRSAYPDAISLVCWIFSVIMSCLECTTVFLLFVVEAVCSFFFVFIGCGLTINWLGEETARNVFFFMLKSISWCFGFTSAFLVNILTYFSGGFFNPALTIALAANRNISPKRAVCIVWAQLTGGKKYDFTRKETMWISL